MEYDFESRAWAENRKALSGSLDAGIDKLGYLVGALIVKWRAAGRRARWYAQFP